MKKHASPTLPTTSTISEIDLAQVTGAAADKTGIAYQVGYVIGALEAKAMDLYESYFGDVD